MGVKLQWYFKQSLVGLELRVEMKCEKLKCFGTGGLQMSRMYVLNMFFLLYSALQMQKSVLVLIQTIQFI